MPRAFDGAFEDLLEAIRDWAEIGNPMPLQNAQEKLSWLFQEHGILPDTPAGLEQVEAAQRHLEETVRQACEHASTRGSR